LALVLVRGGVWTCRGEAIVNAIDANLPR